VAAVVESGHLNPLDPKTIHMRCSPGAMVAAAAGLAMESTITEVVHASAPAMPVALIIWRRSGRAARHHDREHRSPPTRPETCGALVAIT
jgi:hypothetical protein